MKLTEKQWGGYKGKYKRHLVEIRMSQSNDWKWGYAIYKDDSHVYTSSYSGELFDTKELAAEAAVKKIDGNF